MPRHSTYTYNAARYRDQVWFDLGRIAGEGSAIVEFTLFAPGEWACDLTENSNDFDAIPTTINGYGASIDEAARHALEAWWNLDRRRADEEEIGAQDATD